MTSTPASSEILFYHHGANERPTHHPRHVRTKIDGGLLIPYADACEWFKRTYETALPPFPDDSPDFTVICSMLEFIEEHDYPYDIRLVSCWDPEASYFLLTTQTVCGEFRKDEANLNGVAEVPDGLKDILKPGEAEERARKAFFKDFGIETAGFGCFFG